MPSSLFVEFLGSKQVSLFNNLLPVEPSAVHMNCLTDDVAILVQNEKKGSAGDLVGSRLLQLSWVAS